MPFLVQSQLRDISPEPGKMRLYLIVLAEDFLAALLIPSEALNGRAAHIPRSHILEQGVKCAEQALPHGDPMV